MDIYNYNFNWEGHLFEIDYYASDEIAGLYVTFHAKLRIDGKVVDEKTKLILFPAYIFVGSVAPLLAAQVKDSKGKSCLVKVQFGRWTTCRATIDDSEVFKSN